MIAAAALAGGLAHPADAVTGTPMAVLYVAPTGTDTGTCLSSASPCGTISYAVTEAETFTGDDATIYVRPGQYDENVAIAEGTNPTLAIVGEPGASTVNGGGNGTVFTITSGTVSVDGLTITDGDGELAGGVEAFDDSAPSDVTLADDAIEDDTARSGAGGVYSGGYETTNMIDDTISNDTGPVAAVYNQFSTVTLFGSTLANDSGGLDNVGVTAATDDTFVDDASGTFTRAIHSDEGSLSLVNDTISGNANGGVVGEGTVSFANTILADNGGNDCTVTVTDDGYNVADDDTCGFTATGSLNSQSDSSIELGSLGSHGGVTDTEAIGTSSIAHDLVPIGDCPPVDQRGVPHPAVEGAPSCDAGAYQVTTKLITPHISVTESQLPSPAPSGVATVLTATATNGAPQGLVQFATVHDGKKVDWGRPVPFVYDPSSGTDTATIMFTSPLKDISYQAVAAYQGNNGTFHTAKATSATFTG